MSRHNAAATGPDPIDVHVGAMIRDRRKALGKSQQQLAKHLNLTFQQVQKYEKGVNRISASMMWKAAEFLECPPGFFFEGLQGAGHYDEAHSRVLGFVQERRASELMDDFLGMTADQRHSLCTVAAAIRGRLPQDQRDAA